MNTSIATTTPEEASSLTTIPPTNTAAPPLQSRTVLLCGSLKNRNFGIATLVVQLDSLAVKIPFF